MIDKLRKMGIDYVSAYHDIGGASGAQAGQEPRDFRGNTEEDSLTP